MVFLCYLKINPNWEDPGKAWKIAEKIRSTAPGGQIERTEAVGSNRAPLAVLRISGEGILPLDNNFG
jgi:hypothetical protein